MIANKSITIKNTGEINVSIGLKEELTENRIKLIFKVSDTGIGIPEEKIPVIFDSFAQASKGISLKYGGTGLGTTISKQFVELMGGHIEVNSVEGKGTCFSFTVNFKLGDQNNIKHTQIKGEGVKKISLKGYKILAADDYPINCQIIESFFSTNIFFHITIPNYSVN